MPELTGEWVEHPDANYSGLYDPLEHCPGFAMDFTCARPYEPAAPNPELHAREFRQVPASPVLALRGYCLAPYTTTHHGGPLPTTLNLAAAMPCYSCVSSPCPTP